MQIHTDQLMESDLWAHLPSGCYLDVATQGSRSRARRFDVSLSAEHGSDAHGIKRCYARNSGQYGSAGDYDRAATYVEWGDWMMRLFKLDPDAKMGPYDGAAEFVRLTTHWAPHRPDREHAVTHAARWARELDAVAV